MASITQYYGITGPVPFQDVDVSSDNLRFLDPHRIRLAPGPTPFKADAVRCLDTFFDTTKHGVLTLDASARHAAQTNLYGFREPWETRLGMASTGFHGHGAAEDIGERIWNALTTSLEALVEVCVLKRLEHLPLFVEGVDRDITSDITTRIVFGPLNDFTAAMVAAFSEFTAGGHATRMVSRPVWDPTKSAWTVRDVELPVADGKPLLLVPNTWVGRSLLMSPTRFYETSLLSYVQDERSVVLAGGKVLKTPKPVLKEDRALKRGRATHLAVTQHAHARGDDLVAEFEKFILSRPIKNAD